MKRLEIPAIHDKDLDFILKELRILEKIQNSEVNCLNCNELINRENIGGIKREKNSFNIVCDDPECLASESLKEGNKDG